MFKCVYRLTILTILVTSAMAGAQNLLNGPEHATYDAANDRYLICSFYSGAVVAIDNEGVQTNFITGLGRAYSNHISGDTLYVTCGQYNVRAYDLNSGTLLWAKYVAGSVQLDGIASDNAGHLYINDAAINGRIYEFNVSDQTYSIFVSSGLPTYPQDLIFDEANNRLLVVSYATNAPILAVSLDDASITSLVTTPFGNMDGIARANDGDFYVTCYSEGIIYKYTSAFTNPPVVVSTGHEGPSGLGYNSIDNELVVPNFNGNRVDLIILDDFDDDDVLDFRDNCPSDYNPEQMDSDADGDGDACDGCPDDYNPEHADGDADGVEDACDNCPEHYNPGQEDSNGNDVGDPCDYVCGDANSDLNVNILDIVYLINYKYKGGSAPEPMEAADFNHDYMVNILDIVYMINYEYKDGPIPECIVW